MAVSLKEANRCYMAQVGENEQLKKELDRMQTQHQSMLERFAEFEERLNRQQMGENRKVKVIEEEKIKVIKDTFQGAIAKEGVDVEIGIKKIQELLLDFNDKSNTLSQKEIGESLFMHFISMKSQE